jgi:hypothetical protein
VPHSALWALAIAALHIATLMLRAGLVIDGLAIAVCICVMAIPARILSRFVADPPVPQRSSATFESADSAR